VNPVGFPDCHWRKTKVASKIALRLDVDLRTKKTISRPLFSLNENIFAPSERELRKHILKTVTTESISV
jgi:hypothetical protein